MDQVVYSVYIHLVSFLSSAEKRDRDPVFPLSKLSWIMRSHSFCAISSRGTVRSALTSSVATVTSPADSQRIFPVCASQSCNHNLRVVTRLRIKVKPWT